MQLVNFDTQKDLVVHYIIKNVWIILLANRVVHVAAVVALLGGFHNDQNYAQQKKRQTPKRCSAIKYSQKMTEIWTVRNQCLKKPLTQIV